MVKMIRLLDFIRLYDVFVAYTEMLLVDEFYFNYRNLLFFFTFKLIFQYIRLSLLNRKLMFISLSFEL